MNIKNIIKILSGKTKPGQKIYLVGGFLRDVLLKRKTNDLDFVVNKNIRDFVNSIALKLKGKVIILDDRNRIYRIIVSGSDGETCNLDFSHMQGKNIQLDLDRRDFTINAMAMDIEHKDIIDPFGGIKDLNNKIIRKVSDRIFNDDPLRLLRAYRFQAELGFDIEQDTSKLIRKYARFIKKPAKERVRYELLKILQTNDSSKIVDVLDKQKLLEPIFPEILVMKKSARRFYFHPEGLWQHSKESLVSLEIILKNVKKLFPQSSEKIIRHITPRIGLIKFITLFHDLAKPKSIKRINNRIRFFGHEREGAKKIARIMGRLKFSNKEISIAEKIVKNHMRPGNLLQAKILTERAIYRFFRDLGDETVDLLLLSFADRHSYLKIRATKKEVSDYKKFAGLMIEKFFKQKELEKREKIVNGHIIMKKFGLKPGPIIGKLLKIVEENYILGKIKTTELALEFIKTKCKRLLRNLQNS